MSRHRKLKMNKEIEWAERGDDHCLVLGAEPNQEVLNFWAEFALSIAKEKNGYIIASSNNGRRVYIRSAEF
jgi:hypothetical protein